MAIKEYHCNRRGADRWMNPLGLNEEGIVVSTFNFEWTLRVKGLM